MLNVSSTSPGDSDVRIEMFCENLDLVFLNWHLWQDDALLGAFCVHPSSVLNDRRAYLQLKQSKILVGILASIWHGSLKMSHSSSEVSFQGPPCTQS
jgi:hypothetical protein